MRLAQAQGSVLLFLPDTCLRKLQSATSIGLPVSAKEQITWQVVVRIGFVDLVSSELEDLKPADTLLYTQEVELVLPAGIGGCSSERGWRAGRDESNANSFAVKEFFERSARMEENTNPQGEVKTATKVELAALPVRIHVVLSQVELSLKDLEGLTDGSVIQLDERQSGAVQLVANGKVLGAGELVEIDNRLGVQITHWRMG